MHQTKIPGAADAATGAKTNVVSAKSTSCKPPLATAQAPRKRRPLPPLHGRILRRLNELRRLAQYLDDRNEPLGDPAKWAMLLADCLLCHTKGCDYFTFRDALRSVPALDLCLDEDTVMDAIHAVCGIAKRRGAKYRHISAKVAGEKLGLREMDRKACGIITMRAVDNTETPAEAKARRQEQDRARMQVKRLNASDPDKEAERKRKRESERRRRAAKGAKPHTESRARTKPWLQRVVCPP
jgi:hypothetical protein